MQRLEQEQTTRKPNEVLFDGYHPPTMQATQSFASQGQAEINRILNGITDKRVRRAFQESARDSLNTFTINVNQGARNRLIDQNKANGFRIADELMDDIVMGGPSQSKIANQNFLATHKMALLAIMSKWRWMDI